MRLVLAALSRPMTVLVALIAIALCAVLALERMPVDIFPQVGDPAIYVAQPYGGMDPAQMEGYLTYYLSLIHISEPTRLGMISYAVFCLKKKKKHKRTYTQRT